MEKPLSEVIFDRNFPRNRKRASWRHHRSVARLRTSAYYPANNRTGRVQSCCPVQCMYNRYYGIKQIQTT